MDGTFVFCVDLFSVDIPGTGFLFFFHSLLFKYVIYIYNTRRCAGGIHTRSVRPEPKSQHRTSEKFRVPRETDTRAPTGCCCCCFCCGTLLVGCRHQNAHNRTNNNIYGISVWLPICKGERARVREKRVSGSYWSWKRDETNGHMQKKERNGFVELETSFILSIYPGTFLCVLFDELEWVYLRAQRRLVELAVRLCFRYLQIVLSSVREAVGCRLWPMSVLWCRSLHELCKFAVNI